MSKNKNSLGINDDRYLETIKSIVSLLPIGINDFGVYVSAYKWLSDNNYHLDLNTTLSDIPCDLQTEFKLKFL